MSAEARDGKGSHLGGGAGGAAGAAEGKDAGETKEMATVSLEIAAGDTPTSGCSMSLSASIESRETVVAEMAAMTKSGSAKTVVSITVGVKPHIDAFDLGNVCGMIRTAHDAAVSAAGERFLSDTKYSKILEAKPIKDANGTRVRFTMAFGSSPNFSIGMKNAGVPEKAIPDLAGRFDACLRINMRPSDIGMAKNLENLPSRGSFSASAKVPRHSLKQLRSAIKTSPSLMRSFAPGAIAGQLFRGAKLSLEFDDVREVLQEFAIPFPDQLGEAFRKGVKTSPMWVSGSARSICDACHSSFTELQLVEFVSLEHNLVAAMKFTDADIFSLLPTSEDNK